MTNGAIHGTPNASFKVSGSIAYRGLAVKLTADNTVAIATAVSDVVIGFTADSVETSQTHIGIVTSGFALALAGGTIARGDELTVDSAGKVVTSTADTDKICGYAMQAASSDEYVEIRIMPSVATATGGVNVETTVITTAEILALNATPISIVPAPGAGYYNIVEKIIASIDFAAAAYATNTTVEFRYTDGSGTKVTADAAAILDAAADKAVTVSGIEAELVLTTNAAIVAVAATGDPVTGDSNMKVTVVYRTVALAE